MLSLLPFVHKNDMTKLYTGDLMMGAATFFWGGMTVFSKQLLSEMPEFTLIAVRFLIAFLACLAVFPRLYRTLNRQTVWHSFVIGFWLFVSYTLMIYGVARTTASNSGFIMSMSVVFVPIILAVWKRQTPSLQLVISIIVTLTGIGLLSLSDRLTLNSGDLLVLSCAFFYAIQMVFTEKYAKTDEPVLLGSLQLLFVSSFAFICSLIMEDFTLPQSIAGWVQLGYLSVICGSVGFIFQTAAQKRIPSSHASLIFATMPVPVALFSYFLLGENIMPRQLGGIIVVIIGVAVMEYKKSPGQNTVCRKDERRRYSRFPN